MVHQSTPSSKALGKRPARGIATTASPSSILTSNGGSPAPDYDAEDYSAPPSTTGSTRTNQKRVLPNRARRGGPGAVIGTSDIDVTILEMLKRNGESDPLIPSKTVFILITDSRFLPSASTSELDLNQYANERYFDRPEVIKAYKAQHNIQIPEFTQLTDEEMVGGRLRARSGELECADLSDTAYEKRHRKHELLEKRQRLREKEKLQHQHYKLKERIEQLRIVDYTAFLALPAESFGGMETPVDEELTYVAGASTNGAAAFHEGERRRKLMLDVALSLEERYRTLLPLERRVLEKDKHIGRMGSLSVEPSIYDEGEEAAGPERDATESVASGRSKPIKLKLTLRPPTVPPSPSPSYAPPRSSSRRRGVSADRDLVPASPESALVDESITVTASHRGSTPRTRSRTATRTEPSPPTSTYQQDHEPAIADMLPASVHPTPHYVASSDHLVPTCQETNLARMTYPEPAYVDLSYSVPRYAFPHQTAPHFELQVHHLGPEDFEAPPRKKTRTSQVTVDRTDAPADYAAIAQHPPTNHLPHIPSPPLVQSEPSAQELFEPSATMQPEPTAPSVDSGPPKETEVSAPPARPEFTVPLVQPEPALPSIQPEPVEPPMEYEPISPPVEHGYEYTAPLKEQESVAPAKRFESPAPPRRRRGSIVPPKRRETVAPVLAASSIPSTVSSLRAYEIPSGPGRHRPLPYILAASRYNVAPGRKTGRFVKAFGVEVPAFDEEVEFRLPEWLIGDVDAMRTQYEFDEDDDSAISDADPPMNGIFMGSTSGSGYGGMVQRHFH